LRAELCTLGGKGYETGGNTRKHPGLDFTYGVETRHFVGIAKVPNLSHYKMMVLNLQRVTKNDNMILLQNEDWF